MEEDILQSIDDMLDGHVNVNDVLKETICEFIDTPVEDKAKLFQRLVFYKPELFQEWYEQQRSKVKEISLSVFPNVDTKFTNKEFNAFYTKFNEYLNSDQYKQSVVRVVTSYTKSIQGHYGIESQIMTSVMLNLQENLLKSLASQVQCEAYPTIKTTSENTSSGGRGKIRYIGEYCIAKIKYSISCALRNKLFNTKYAEEVEKLDCQMKLLESVCMSENELMSSTSDPKSLQETKRRQNVRESLTNINDSVFSFFSDLDKKCWDFLNYENMVIHSEDIYQALENAIVNDDTELLLTWTNIFRETDIGYSSGVNENSSATDIVHDICAQHVQKIDILLSLYPKICNLLMRVCISQFRKDYITFLKKEKGKAWRKKVMDKSNKSVKKLEINFLLNDPSSKKSGSHYRLKSELANNKDLCSSNAFNKNNLVLIRKAYGVQLSLKLKKGEMAQILIKKIEESDEITFPENLAATTLSKTVTEHPETISCIPEVSEAETTSAISSQQSTEHLHDSGSEVPECSTASISPTCIHEKERSGRKAVKRTLQTRKGKGKGKGKSKRSKTKESQDETCTICNQPFREGSQLICCDTCQCWFDRSCAKLESDELWNIFQQEDAQFDRPLCQ